MNKIEKQMFRHYIYGRVNEYYMFKEYRLAPNETYKKFKYALTFSRFGFPEKYRPFLLGLIQTASYFEEVLSIIIVFVRFVWSLVLVIFTQHRDIDNEQLLLGIKGQKVNTLFQQANIATNDISVVTSPYCKSDLYKKNWGKSILLHSNLSVKEVFSAFVLACRMIFFIRMKYGNRDCLFRAYSSFDYFLSYYFFIKLSPSNTVYYISINDRWTYIFGHLKCKTVFLQHGALNKNKVLFIMGAIGTTDVGYYINATQRDICNKYMFVNTPEDHYFSQMEFTANEKLSNNGKKHVLLVCETIYFYKEKGIIVDISRTNNYNLYVKPHPQNDPSRYKELQKVYGFIILGKNEYPAVDYVISYDSTLVLEYQSKGVSTLMYEDVDFDENYYKLLNG